MNSRGYIPRQLVTHEHETSRHQQRIGRQSLPLKRRTLSPAQQQQQDEGERHNLTQFNADVKRDNVGHKPFFTQGKVGELGGKPHAVAQPKDKNRSAGIYANANAFEPAHVLKGLVDNREANDRVNQPRIHLHACEHASQQSETVPGSKQGDVEDNVPRPRKKEQHTHQIQQMIEPGHHVFGTQVHEWTNRDARDALNVSGVGGRYVVCQHWRGEDKAGRGSSLNHPNPCRGSSVRKDHHRRSLSERAQQCTWGYTVRSARNIKVRPGPCARILHMLNGQNILSVARTIAHDSDTPLTLDGLAASTGWSASYLQRSFTQRFGESPKQFQQRLRLNQAAIRLAHTDDPVIDVAVETGYASHEVFARAFKRQFRCTPTVYRRRTRANRAPLGSLPLLAELVRQLGPCVGLFRTTLNQTRTSAMPPSEVTRVVVEPKPILFIQRRVQQSELQTLFMECFPGLFGHCMQNGYEMAGHPMARYVDFTPGMATVDCMIPLQQAAPADGEMQAGTLQAGPAAFATHTGPYDTLPETYGAIEKWIEDNGHTRNGPSWDWYVTDPGEVTDPNEWKTEVYFPIGG